MEGIERLRAERAAARDRVGVAAGRLAAARRARREADTRRADPAQRERLVTGHEQAAAALRDARAAEAAARERLHEAVAGLEGTPAERIAQLDATHPVAFFPVRIETRFRRPPAPAIGGELLVRIYPDGLLADDHEPLLSATEVAAGRDYWRRAFRDGGERDAWTALLAEASPERAAWIVARTTPTNRDALGTGTEPQLPGQSVRPEGWHRAPEARGLPERWIVSAFRDAQRVHQVTSGPIREGLALGLRLTGDGDDEQGVDLSGDGLTVAPELAWAYDFAEAEQAGMAVRLQLTLTDLTDGFDTMLVMGVRTTEPADKQAAQLTALLQAHRHSRGLAFVPQGAKTNNTATDPSDYPPADPAGTVSFEVARGAPLATADGGGRRFAEALGIDPAAVDHVWGADRDEQAAARAMASALWPATIGYFLEQFLAPDVEGVDPQALRGWMQEWVRPRGPLPAFRVGAVPYGLLPVAPTRGWVPAEDEDTPPELAEALRRLTALWTPITRVAPHVGRSLDGDRDLVELLSMDASTQTARIRRAIGYDAMWNVMTAGGLDLPAWQQAQKDVARAILEAIGEPDWDPRALYLSYQAIAHDFTGPLVADGLLSETDPLAFDYVAWLRAAAIDDLEDQLAPPTEEPVTALLYLMLRHALLNEADGAAKGLLDLGGLLLPFEVREPELIGILPGTGQTGPARPAPDRTAWERFATRIPGVTGARTVGQVLTDPGAITSTGSAEIRAALAALTAYRGALETLEGLPTAELERLFTESLDICSHRLDAWVTSLATRRLDALRRETPSGIWLGCYGWVENLKADPPVETVEVTRPDGSTAQARTDSGGYMYAPSMLHGATAAILRSAYLTRGGAKGTGREPYSVDLSSRRVRTALALLDGVRDRQPLGAVLGYQFERGLHEGHPGIELDRFIDTFRSLYPPVANKAEDSGAPAARIAARNVVDGLRLLTAWQAGTVPWGTGELTPTTGERRAIEAELRRLDGSVDAVGDLLLGESVFQVVKGSTAGAAATLDSLAKGQRPPEPEVVTVPRGGTVLHQRVALVLGGGTPAAGWDQVAATPRGAAAPELSAWLGGLLGDPALVACRVTPEGGAARTVTLRDLGCAPVDLLLTIHATEAGGGDGSAELDRRVAWHVAGETGADVAITIDYERAGSPDQVPFAVVFELLAPAAKLVGLGRALEPADLLPPEQAQTAEAADSMPGELELRASAARLALDGTRDALAAAVATRDPARIRAGLVAAAALGVAGAFPPGRHDVSEAAGKALLPGARGAVRELERRRAATDAATGAADVLRAVFGRAFPVVPRFRPAAPDLLAPTLASEPGLGPDPDAVVEGWLAQLTRVRQPLDAWRDVQVYGRALGRVLGRPRIAQLPLEPGAAWAALPFGAELARPRSGLVSLALLGEAPPATGEPWAGLLVDTWPELLPNREEDAGVVFHYDAPAAKAPHAVLLAVPPERTGSWSYDDLERTLLDTLTMARIRALDLSNLGMFGQLIPMTFLTSNTQNQTVSTSFDGLIAADPHITPLQERQ